MRMSESEQYKNIYGGMQRAVRSVFGKENWEGEAPTLYSTRHQAVANARVDGLTQKEIMCAIRSQQHQYSPSALWQEKSRLFGQKYACGS